MAEVEMYTGINGWLRVNVKGDFVLRRWADNPNVDRYLDVKYQRGADPQLEEFVSITSAGKTLARISYTCMQNNMSFDFSSVTKKKFVSDGSNGIRMELPLSDKTMEDLLVVIEEELKELSKSAAQQKERNGFV